MITTTGRRLKPRRQAVPQLCLSPKRAEKRTLDRRRRTTWRPHHALALFRQLTSKPRRRAAAQDQQPSSSSTAAAPAASPAQTDRWCSPSIPLAPAVSTASSGKRRRCGRFVTEPTRSAAAADRLLFALREKGASDAAARLQRDVLALRPFVGTFLIGDVVSRSHVVFGRRAVLGAPLVALIPHSDGPPRPPFKLMGGLDLRAEVLTAPSGRKHR